MDNLFKKMKTVGKKLQNILDNITVCVRENLVLRDGGKNLVAFVNKVKSVFKFAA